MKHTLKGFLVTVPTLLLLANTLVACGTNNQSQSGPGSGQQPGIVVARCNKQFWPTIKAMATAQSSSRTVYFISGIHLYALNAGNGAMRWCMYASIANTHLSMFGNAATMFREGPPPRPDGFSALTVSNGTVYTCSANDYTYAFNGASGALLWRHDTGFANTSAPLVANGVVYVGSGSIFALNQKDGSQRWQFPTPDVVTSSPVLANGVIYLGSYGNRVYALDASTGSLRWQFDTGGRVYVDPVVTSGAIFFGAGDDGPTLYAVNTRDGKLLWHNTLLVDSSLATATGILYVGSGNYLYALNQKDGSLVWRRQIPTPFNPLLINGLIYVASSSGGIYALNASDGSLRWHNSLNPMHSGETTTPMLVAGEVYIATIDVGISPSQAIIHALNAANGTEDWYASVSWNVSSIGVAA